MSEVLHRFIDRLERLPEPIQEQYAARFLSELEKELQEGDGLPAPADAADADQPVRFEDIKHLLGVVDGPGDLSTNPDYLDDLGKNSLH